MKLWVKMFLCTLALVVFTTAAMAQIILQLDFSATLARETERSVSEHSYFSAGISSRLAYKKADKENVQLSWGEVEKLLVQAAADQAGSETGMAIYRSGELVASANTPLTLRAGMLLEELQKTLSRRRAAPRKSADSRSGPIVSRHLAWFWSGRRMSFTPFGKLRVSMRQGTGRSDGSSWSCSARPLSPGWCSSLSFAGCCPP